MHVQKYFLLLILFLFCISCQSNTNTTVSNEKTAKSSEKSPVTEAKPIAKKKSILFFGNSLTAGLRVDPADAFVGLIGKRLDSLDMPYEVINSGVSGETTTDGLNRIAWVLDNNPPDIFVLELGGNDALRGIDPAFSKKNLKGIVDIVRERHPTIPIILAGMEAPPNMGETYTTAFRQMYRDLAKSNKLLLIPFLLEGVGGVPALNQADGIHPTEEGHKVVAEVIWSVLKKAL